MVDRDFPATLTGRKERQHVSAETEIPNAAPQRVCELRPYTLGGTMKLNEHPRCACASCRRGASSGYGQHTHRNINRKIRHRAKVALRKDATETPFTAVSTPYTD
jgi:hypothetical protein